MAKDHPDDVFDRELADLPRELRWREWMRRIEAVLFASASPVSRESLSRVVGEDAAVELLIEDLAADLKGRSFEVSQVADGWLLRTRPIYASAVRTAADIGVQALDLRGDDITVLAVIAYHQPLTRDELKDVLGREISRDQIARLRAQDLIEKGPRSPRRGAPYTFVTTRKFLSAFDITSLQDLPDLEQLEEAGLGRDEDPGDLGF